MLVPLNLSHAPCLPSAWDWGAFEELSSCQMCVQSPAAGGACAGSGVAGASAGAGDGRSSFIRTW